eukprot:maker-scaffold67_size430214-snap-gene-1.18 protein:Tk00777 transcript:maker-scaffold67_size430214-snap-gene-1.18-mRNA-1 annotation:"hypothetical protein DAPPUDRAFT_304078"
MAESRDSSHSSPSTLKRGSGLESTKYDNQKDQFHSGETKGVRSDPETADYEEAIAAAGYGRFHYWFLFVCGWANASDAVEVLCISFLLPAAQCDLQLTSSDKGWLSAILFVGMLIGGYIWGSLGDSFGRKKILIVAMFVNALCGFISSLAQTKAVFFTFRFLSGVGVGGSIPIVWSYFAEFQPKQNRGGMLSFLAAFWMVGNVVVAGIAWAIIPADIGYDTDDPNEFEYNSWRIFVLVCGLPALLVGVALFWFPESPKFLLAKGDEKAAIKVFAQIYAFNTGNPASSYPVKRIISDQEDPRMPISGRLGSSWKLALREAKANLITSFSGKLTKIMLLMLYINFAIQFGYYGLWLWFPELFNKLDVYYQTHNETRSVCEVTNFNEDNPDDDADPFCGPKPDAAVFINSFIISLAALPGNIWTIWQMDKLGRKFFLILSMVLSGVSVFFIYLVKTTTANLIVSCVFGLVSTMGFNALDCLGIELFPTHVRSTAMAITLVAARLGAILGNVVFGYFVETNCAIPVLAVAILLQGISLVGRACFRLVGFVLGWSWAIAHFHLDYIALSIGMGFYSRNRLGFTPPSLHQANEEDEDEQDEDDSTQSSAQDLGEDGANALAIAFFTHALSFD